MLHQTYLFTFVCQLQSEKVGGWVMKKNMQGKKTKNTTSAFYASWNSVRHGLHWWRTLFFISQAPTFSDCSWYDWSALQDGALSGTIFFNVHHKLSAGAMIPVNQPGALQTNLQIATCASRCFENANHKGFCYCTCTCFEGKKMTLMMNIWFICWRYVS